MDFVAGWDGGGTKTRVSCLRLTGESLASGVFGPLNLNGAQESEVRRTVSEALAFQRQEGNCVSLVVSAAGVSHPEAAALLNRLFREGGYNGPLSLVGDQESALFGAVGGHGAVLIAGTGSICFGRNAAGETARSGGYGHLVDDEGSGYAIGRDILTAILRAEDGRTPPTRLRELLFRDADWQGIPAILRHLYMGGPDKAKIASLAPLALEARDDPAAQAILERAARELTLLATAVIGRLGLQSERVAFSGSVLTHMEPVREAVSEALRKRYPGIKGFSPEADAATGAARMALVAYVAASPSK